MRAARGRNAAPFQGLSVALGLGGVALGGFVLGLLAGALWEDPGLVTSYLFGRTQAVAWGPEALGEGPPEELAAAVPPPQAAASEAREVSPPAPRPPPRPVSAPPPAGRLAVQVGAFAESGSAEKLAASLRDKGFSVYVTPGTAPGPARWRVRVGPFRAREEAERAAARLKQHEKLPTWVLTEDRPS